ncbi:unnamed protein product [Trifolium pratense]|uniref:Uncharacterized protein n=1 Tax=Trifolium pratense TaxID=57577 RepID=A0ACB0JE30_TRIPR|nr:unnamed protein product [Trifolium pratense]
MSGRIMEKLNLYGLSHLFITVFLHNLSTFMVVPAITDVTMAALCPGQDECSIAIYLTGFQQAADNVPESGRSTAFGILSGIGSSAFVCGTLAARFLSTAQTFQVSTFAAVLGAVYMQIFLRDSVMDQNNVLCTPIISQGKPIISCKSKSNMPLLKALRSLQDLTSFLNSSKIITQAAIVAFFSNLADVGFHGSMMYYLKAQFHFDKNHFADLMIISGIAGTVSQLFLMPIFAPTLGEARLLSIGLFFHFLHMFIYSIAWSSWVPYAAAMFSILFVFSQPCIRSIVSKQVDPHEQGRAQGCISGICSIAHIVSPLVFSPLTALFLSEKAPFSFPGFSILCIGIASMISFFQSMMLRVVPPILS